MNPYKDKGLKKFIKTIPQDEVDRQIHLQNEENKRVFKKFIDSLNKGECSLCGEKMNFFDISKPCFHWFTYPTKIKKKYYQTYLNNPIGFFRLDSYFRWLANTEKPICNINDLKDETSKTSYLETTYRYKNIEWAFSIGYTDKEGHENSKVGKKPHYHIQMKVNDRIFLKFNDFHIPFSDEDLFTMELLKQPSDKVQMGYSFGHGMSIFEDEKNLELLHGTMKITDDIKNADFNIETVIASSKSETISGELIQQSIEESKRTKKPIGKILQRLFSDANVTSVLSPGNGVPKMTKRSGKNNSV